MSKNKDDSSPQCKNCKHWDPLFTGEVWGVRSFVDAPESERVIVEGRLKAFFEKRGYHKPLESVGDLSDKLNWWASEVPDGFDWPYWGECKLTELGNDESNSSLARAIDGSLDCAVLRCRCNFGCVQWARFTP